MRLEPAEDMQIPDSDAPIFLGNIEDRVIINLDKTVTVKCFLKCNDFYRII